MPTLLLMKEKGSRLSIAVEGGSGIMTSEISPKNKSSCTGGIGRPRGLRRILRRAGDRTESDVESRIVALWKALVLNRLRAGRVGDHAQLRRVSIRMASLHELTDKESQVEENSSFRACFQLQSDLHLVPLVCSAYQG